MKLTEKNSTCGRQRLLKSDKTEFRTNISFQSAVCLRAVSRRAVLLCSSRKDTKSHGFVYGLGWHKTRIHLRLRSHYSRSTAVVPDILTHKIPSFVVKIVSEGELDSKTGFPDAILTTQVAKTNTKLMLGSGYSDPIEQFGRRFPCGGKTVRFRGSLIVPHSRLPRFYRVLSLNF